MLRYETFLIARDTQDFRTAELGRGTPRQTRTSLGFFGTTTNLSAASHYIGHLPTGDTNVANGHFVPPPPPDPSMAPGLHPESIDYIVSVVLGQTLDSQLAKVLAYEEISSFNDLTDLTDPVIETLQYTEPILDENGNETGEETLRPISRHECKLIIFFKCILSLPLFYS